MSDTRRIDEIVVGPRFRRDFGGVDALAASIDAVGLLQPPGITPAGRLLWGECRLRACRSLGWAEIPVAVRDVDPGDMVAVEAAENFARKNFTLSEAVAIKRAMQPNLPKFGRSEPAREQIASYAGFSHETLRKAEAVVVAAEAEPERFGKLVANMDRIGRVDGFFRQLMNLQQAERIRAAPPPLPSGKYRVIVVDPPWPMERIVRDIDPDRSAPLDYPTMTEAELVAFGDQVTNVAADDCHAFLWTTQRFLPMGLRLLDAWGFSYVLTMVWHKNGGFQPFGLPQFNCEFVLYARKGAPAFVDTKAFNCCFLALRQGHSVKPDEFYETLVRVTDGPRLDMFARKERPGWTVWGDEVPKAEAAE
jgi:N6-adenosine-specific RNA methylase IME4